MIQIDDLNRAGKLQIGQIPDPFGSVAEGNLLCRAAPAAIPGFQINAFAKLVGGLDGTGIGSGIRVAYRITFLAEVVWVNTQPSLTSRVCAAWPSALPVRPSVSFLTTGMPVPSIST